MLRGCTFKNQQVTDQCDAGLYGAVFKKDGILWGCAMSVKNNALVIQTGEMIVSGRVIWIDGVTTVPFENPIENGYGRAVLTIDLSKAATKKDFAQLEVSVQYNASASSFPALKKGKINQSLGDMIYQIVLAAVSISGANVTGITQMMGAAEADADTLNGKTRLEMLKTIYPVGCIYMTASSENPSKTFGFGTWEQWGAGRVPVGIDTQDADFNTAEKAGGAKTSGTPSGGAGTSGGTSLTEAHLAAHRHTGPSHTHTGPSHTHTAPGHTHSGPNHWHQLNLTRGNYNTFSIAWGSNVANLANIVKFQTNKGDPVIAAAHTAGTAMTTNQLFVDQLNNCNVTANSGTGATGSAGAAATTAAGTGATGAAGTGATGSAGSGSAHTHSTPAHTHGAQSIVQPYITCYMWKRTA